VRPRRWIRRAARPPALVAQGSVKRVERSDTRTLSGDLGAFDDEVGEIDIVARLARLLVLPLSTLFRFQLLALALGLLALTFDD
jgi:hypothetical protein